MKKISWALAAVAIILPPGLDKVHAATPDAAVVGAEPRGISAEVAERAGISPELVREIDRLTTEANVELDALRKKHRSAQQALERLLRAAQPPEDVVLTQIERVGTAETEIRKNRVRLMLQVRRLLGPELWSNLQVELEVQKRLAQRRERAPGHAQDTAPRVGEPVEVESVSGTLRSEPAPKVE